jgi:hypothetical protein
MSEKNNSIAKIGKTEPGVDTQGQLDQVDPIDPSKLDTKSNLEQIENLFDKQPLTRMASGPIDELLSNSLKKE